MSTRATYLRCQSASEQVRISVSARNEGVHAGQELKHSRMLKLSFMRNTSHSPLAVSALHIRTLRASGRERAQSVVCVPVGRRVPAVKAKTRRSDGSGIHPRSPTWRWFRPSPEGHTVNVNEVTRNHRSHVTYMGAHIVGPYQSR